MGIDSGVIPDSSVWIAFFREEDSQRGKAEHAFDALRGVEIIVPEYVLVEVATALKRKGYEKAAKEFVATVIEGTGSTFLPAATIVHETAELFCSRQDKLSFIDTALLVLSRQYRVITFDRALARAITSGSKQRR